MSRLAIRSRLLVSAVALLALVSGATADAGHGDAVVDLTQDSFDAFVNKVPAGEYILIEFFASWCPVCQRFKPEFARVAAALKNARNPPTVHAAAVDCVAQVKLCNRFSPAAFPTIRLGHPGQFAGNGSGSALVEPAHRTAASLLQSLNAALKTTFTLDPPSGASAAVPQAAAATTANAQQQLQQFDLQDVVSSTVLAFEYSVASGLMKRENRKAFVDWMTLVAEAHPHAKCRQGAGNILLRLEGVWPPGEDAPVAQMARFRPCGKGLTAREWGACRGSQPKSRGYTCGLWSLFHSLSLRSRSGDAWLSAVRSFVGAFFQCADCRKHFLQATSRPEMHHLPSPRDAAVWLFRIHNEVNARLMREEGTQGDPVYPKIQWPPPSLCERCRCPGQCAHTFTLPELTDLDNRTVVWDEDEVYSFLMRFYGGEGDRSGPIRPELSAADRMISHPPSSTSSDGGKVDPPSTGGGGANGGRGRGSGEAGGAADGEHTPRDNHNRPFHRFGHGGKSVMAALPDADHGAAAEEAQAQAAPVRVERDPSGRRKEGQEAEWVHTRGDLRPGADPLEVFEAQQRQLRRFEERERRQGAGGARPAVPRRKYHAPGGLHPAVFVAGCALGPLMLYAGFVYMRAMMGSSGPGPKGGRKAAARAGGLPIL